METKTEKLLDVIYKLSKEEEELLDAFYEITKAEDPKEMYDIAVKMLKKYDREPAKLK